MQLILASASPRRRELMSLITDDFEVITADIDERKLEDGLGATDAREVSVFIAKAKAEAVRDMLSAKDREDKVIVAADTSVISGNEIMGKPLDKEDARNMLTKLCGRLDCLLHNHFFPAPICNSTPLHQ